VEPVVSLSSFAYLFSEMVQYHQNRVDSISELERRLESTGFSVGLRVLELLAYRSREYRRETKLMNVLQFVSTVVWKSLFSKPADSLERSIDHADEFMIVDYAPITSTFVSVPADFGGLSVDSYLSGIIAGILEGAGFPARVSAHTVGLEEGETPTVSSVAALSASQVQGLPARKEKTIFLVKFAPSVLARDSQAS
jgi:trafficking protein particle complex subunit 5